MNIETKKMDDIFMICNRITYYLCCRFVYSYQTLERGNTSSEDVKKVDNKTEENNDVINLSSYSSSLSIDSL